MFRRTSVCENMQSNNKFVQSSERKSRNQRVQKLAASLRAVCVASANHQAEVMNQMSQHNGVWIRRGALGDIDLPRKSMQPRRRNEIPCRIYKLLVC